MKKIALSLFIGLQSLIVNGQSIINPQNDSTFYTDFRDGNEWAYIAKEGSIIGVNNQIVKDDYGTYYQITILIQNLTDVAYVFDPSKVTAELYQKNVDPMPLKVYTNEAFQKKIRNSQMWAMALTSFAVGFNAGMAGYQTTYTPQYVAGNVYTPPVVTYNYSAASAAQIAASTQLMVMGKQMEEDRKVRQQGYLKKNTVHSGNGIIGYMNIKRVRGQAMMVDIPVNGIHYKFNWSVDKKSLKRNK